MRLKKILIYLITAVILYAGAGAILYNLKIINRFYIFPGWVINRGETDEDESTVSADGPIIIYIDGIIKKFQIIPGDNRLLLIKTEITKKDTLQCFVDETKDTFKFIIKDSLQIESIEYTMPGKVFVISDIEGNFKGFKQILIGNKIIDENFNWAFGNNHLVLVGDFFDRGLNVTECLWLIYKLESEAEKEGGKVHFILGNHEVMNLKGQLRYLRNKYKENADTIKLEYEKWYSQNSELGRWLRTKNGVEKIGNIMFVHAGIRKNFPEEFTIQQINDNIRNSIDKIFTKEEQRHDLFIGSESPIWYRGISKEEETQEDVNRTLSRFKANKMIVGHTIVDNIKYLYNERVVDIDLEHKRNSENGKMYGLWIEGDNFYVVDNNGSKSKVR